MRPIDADALIEKCGDWYVEEGTESGFIGTLKNLLATEPTIQPQSTTGQLNDGARSTDLIDRQQAIDGKIVIQRTNGVEIYSDEAVPVEYLKNLPSRQPEPSTSCSEFPNNSDTVSRQAAIDALARMMPRSYTPDGSHPADEEIFRAQEVFADCIEALEILPSAQPERKKGEWLPDNNNAYEMRFVCSCCKESEVVPTIGFTKYKPLWDFCPNCGADMRGEKDG